MRVNVRCRWCKARRKLTKHPLAYDKLPGCKVCGKTESGLRKKFGTQIPKKLMGKCLLYLIDSRKKEYSKRKKCFDDCLTSKQGQHYPHQWGGVGCKHREEYLIEFSLRDNDDNQISEGSPCPF